MTETALPEKIENEANTLREELAALMSELERRRQEVLNLRLQLRRHPRVLAGAAALVVAAGFAVRARQRRRRNPWLQLENLGRTLAVASVAAAGRTGGSGLSSAMRGPALGLVASLGAAAARAAIRRAFARPSAFDERTAGGAAQGRRMNGVRASSPGR